MRRIFLTLLSLMISLFSLIIGMTMILSPHENWIWLPQQWLNGSLFKDFRLPGLLLVALIGLPNIWGLWNLLKQHPQQYDRALWGGYCLMGWITLELLFRREIYLIHLTYMMLGVLEILLAYQEKGKWAM